MGSSSVSQSYATDNRQAITDNALGVSSSGNSNNVALKGHIINFGSSQAQPGGGFNFFRNNQPGGAGLASGLSVGGGSNNNLQSTNSTTLNILDGGAIDKSFDFAAFSLSEVLGAIVGSNKQTADQLAGAQISTMQSIGGAIEKAGTVTAEAAQNAANTSKTGLLIVGGAVAVWYFFLRGKK